MTMVYIKDKYSKKALELLSQLPKEAYTVKDDPLRDELQNRLDNIDKGKMELLPIDDKFWDDMDRVIDEAS